MDSGCAHSTFLSAVLVHIHFACSWSSLFTMSFSFTCHVNGVIIQCSHLHFSFWYVYSLFSRLHFWWWCSRCILLYCIVHYGVVILLMHIVRVYGSDDVFTWNSLSSVHSPLEVFNSDDDDVWWYVLFLMNDDDVVHLFYFYTVLMMLMMLFSNGDDARVCVIMEQFVFTRCIFDLVSAICRSVVWFILFVSYVPLFILTQFSHFAYWCTFAFCILCLFSMINYVFAHSRRPFWFLHSMFLFHAFRSRLGHFHFRVVILVWRSHILCSWSQMHTFIYLTHITFITCCRMFVRTRFTHFAWSVQSICLALFSGSTRDRSFRMDQFCSHFHARFVAFWILRILCLSVHILSFRHFHFLVQF